MAYGQGKKGVVMMRIKWSMIIICIISLCFFGIQGQAAERKTDYSFESKDGIRAQKVSVFPSEFHGKQALRIELLPEVAQGTAGVDYIDKDTLALIPGTEGFHNGSIDVDVIGVRSPSAPDYARAFLGVAFRIDNKISKFETLYVRPANARVDDQVRRNHTLQYFSFPDYTFSRFRRETPEKYEAYADLDMEEWTHLHIDVVGEKAKFYINGASQPSLIVNDLKLGSDARGAVGLWTEIGTIAYFSNLRIEFVD